ncbi:MAG: biosynthetic-type acetolactate synthase large subunit [Clostridiales Family XIII bacterium]|jgi:acetolactate synthase-1/2/3 large subunit|nr:biosynthetic-type acetolactate synthase large subunit [Clostridiales Family XIII bacterium]
MTGAEAITASLERAGVRMVFGYPGATIAPFYDALSKSNIRHILVRHEQHAGHAASGYARIAGAPGVCAVTSGPGAMNLVTALGTAYMDSIPLVAITGQVDSRLLGRDVFQEADITGATASFTKHSYLVKRAEDLPRVFREAFHIAGTGRPGPVLIDIPVDVQQQKVVLDPSVGAGDAGDGNAAPRGYKPTFRGHAGQIQRVARALANAERPLICAGGGVFASGASGALRAFAERLNIPVVSTMMGIGAVPTAHPLYMGMLGMHGKSAANAAVTGSDLLLLIGARVSDRAVLLPANLAKNTKIVHIDIDPAEIGKNLDTFIPVVGDARTVLEQLSAREPAPKGSAWTDELARRREKSRPDRAARARGVNPKAFVRMLTTAMPDDYIYAADVGQNQLWSAACCDIREGGRFLTTGGMGTMGYAIGAAVGAKLAAPERFTVAVCGDGSFQMSMSELGTICQHGLDVKIVVMVNGRLGLVAEIQTKQYAGNLTAVDLSGSPDPVKLAAAYGIPGEAIANEGEAEAGIARLLSAKGPRLLACAVDAGESSL